MSSLIVISIPIIYLISTIICLTLHRMKLYKASYNLSAVFNILALLCGIFLGYETFHTADTIRYSIDLVKVFDSTISLSFCTSGFYSILSILFIIFYTLNNLLKINQNLEKVSKESSRDSIILSLYAVLFQLMIISDSTLLIYILMNAICLITFGDLLVSNRGTYFSSLVKRKLYYMLSFISLMIPCMFQLFIFQKNTSLTAIKDLGHDSVMYSEYSFSIFLILMIISIYLFAFNNKHLILNKNNSKKFNYFIYRLGNMVISLSLVFKLYDLLKVSKTCLIFLSILGLATMLLSACKLVVEQKSKRIILQYATVNFGFVLYGIGSGVITYSMLFAIIVILATGLLYTCKELLVNGNCKIDVNYLKTNNKSIFIITAISLATLSGMFLTPQSFIQIEVLDLILKSSEYGGLLNFIVFISYIITSFASLKILFNMYRSSFSDENAEKLGIDNIINISLLCTLMSFGYLVLPSLFVNNKYIYKLFYSVPEYEVFTSIIKFGFLNYIYISILFIFIAAISYFSLSSDSSDLIDEVSYYLDVIRIRYLKVKNFYTLAIYRRVSSAVLMLICVPYKLEKKMLNIEFDYNFVINTYTKFRHIIKIRSFDSEIIMTISAFLIMISFFIYIN